MKNQILILVVSFWMLCFYNLYGQPNLVPRAVDVTCLENSAIHPVPGTPYNYAINVPTPVGTKAYTWLVTQDPNFFAAPGGLTTNYETTDGDILAATGTGYHDPVTGSATMSLTWKSFTYDVSHPVFVVVQVRSTEADACHPNSLKVFMIEPINAFTLDIANVLANGTTVSDYDTPIDRCLSDIISATYDATDPQGVRYDFGTDYLYYIVTAANFTTSWLPTVQITGTNPGETISAVEWFRPSDTGFTTPGGMSSTDGVLYTSNEPVTALIASGTVNNEGESILIRVTLDHTNGTNQYEGLIDETVVVAVDGRTQLSQAASIGDVHYSSTLPVANGDCGRADGFKYDVASQTLKARPDIQSAVPSVIFLPVK